MEEGSGDGSAAAVAATAAAAAAASATPAAAAAAGGAVQNESGDATMQPQGDEDPAALGDAASGAGSVGVGSVSGGGDAQPEDEREDGAGAEGADVQQPAGVASTVGDASDTAADAPAPKTAAVSGAKRKAPDAGGGHAGDEDAPQAKRGGNDGGIEGADASEVAALRSVLLACMTPIVRKCAEQGVPAMAPERHGRALSMLREDYRGAWQEGGRREGAALCMGHAPRGSHIEGEGLSPAMVRGRYEVRSTSGKEQCKGVRGAGWRCWRPGGRHGMACIASASP
eukprot:363371-Chlamydomonas_euryale.AAC.8